MFEIYVLKSILLYRCINVVRVLTKESVELSFDHPILVYMCTERALIQCDIHTRSIKLRIMMTQSHIEFENQEQYKRTNFIFHFSDKQKYHSDLYGSIDFLYVNMKLFQWKSSSSIFEIKFSDFNL
jgi:hypothetical protein